MKILKENKKLNKTERFTCNKCGCEFECDEDEYWVDTGITLTTYPAQYNAYANCPKCYKICHTYTHKNTNTYEYIVAGTPVIDTSSCVTAKNTVCITPDTSICTESSNCKCK